MEKKKISFNIGNLEYDEQKLQFTGYIRGDYCVVKQSKSNGKWYVQVYRDVTFFEPINNDQERGVFHTGVEPNGRDY